jgi:hypothetical protein
VIPVVESMFPIQLLCRQYVQREVQPEKLSIASTIFAVFKPYIASAIPEFSPESLVTLIYIKSYYLFRVIDEGYIKALL